MDRLYEEMAFIAYYFHWEEDKLMNLEHRERKKWCEEISSIHKKVNNQPDNIFDIR